MEHSVYSDPSASPDINTAKMGIIQSLPIDSYLDRHQCSGRNITWHYIHTNGSLPAPYSHCPDLSAILSSHCCSHGTCAPSWFDREFERYGYGKWDGLGDPYNRLTNCTIGNWNSGTIKSNSTAENWNNDITNSSDSTAGRSKNMYHGMKKGGMCLGMEPWLWFIKNHWPPLGVDGRPVKNFEAMKWGDLATDTYGGETRAPAVGWNASVRSGGLDARTVTSNAERRAAGALWGMPAEWLAVARSLHKHKRDDIWIFGVVVAVVILIFVVGVFVRACLDHRHEARATATDPQNNDPACNPEARHSEDQNEESPPPYTAAQNNDLGPHDNSNDPPAYGLSRDHIPLQDCTPRQSPGHTSQGASSYSSGRQDGPQENT